MKKELLTLAGIVFAMAFVFVGSFFAFEAEAADDNECISDTKPGFGVHGTDENGNEFTVALFNKNGKKMAYINDGESTSYGEYKSTKVTTDDHGTVRKVKINNIVSIELFENDGEHFIEDNNGTVYTTMRLSDEDIIEIRKYA